MIWRNGELPEGSPRFTENLSYDLASYGLSLLSMAIRLREQGDEESLVPVALERAGDALEAIVSKGDPDDTTRGFYRLLAAASFHLGGFSARAFSLLAQSLDDANLSDMERMFALLIVRSLRDLEDGITDFREDGQGSDADLLEKYLTDDNGELEGQEQPSGEIEAAISDVLEECFCSGLGIFLVALERGDSELVSDATAELDRGLQTAAELNFVLQWWCFRVASEVVTDLWDSSFHEIVPPLLPGADNERWGRLRALYISSLYKRERAEIDLWPSQIDAAVRSIDTSDNLVVSLPTSAGKTRVAELCILRCLADGKRVVFVTPLRALSAQTEVGLQKTFGPLGISITALYGSIGTSNFEADTLKERQIVVATPEKLDFALRSDPSILDDVGLVVLDEGHMIGLGEREIRYEIQIQRLLSRPDSDLRRIVCLSAILPNGDQFEDFVAWLRKDNPGDAISIDWRPTRVRFGEVSWRNGRARLSLHVGDENPFVPNFFGSRQPLRGQRTVPFPRDQRELVLATAWRLVEG